MSSIFFILVLGMVGLFLGLYFFSPHLAKQYSRFNHQNLLSHFQIKKFFLISTIWTAFTEPFTEQFKVTPKSSRWWQTQLGSLLGKTNPRITLNNVVKFIHDFQVIIYFLLTSLFYEAYPGRIIIFWLYKVSLFCFDEKYGEQFIMRGTTFFKYLDTRCISRFIFVRLEFWEIDPEFVSRYSTIGAYFLTVKRFTLTCVSLFSSSYVLQWFVVFYQFFKTTLIALLVALLLMYYLILFFSITLLKQLAIWFLVGILFFWLMSGFNFFLKRYRFGKFTSAILRFWKRTNMCFWLIEGFLFLIFFYYYSNSSQEPLYFYDFSSLNQEHLFSLLSAYYNFFLLTLVVLILYYLMLNLNSFSFVQALFWFSIASIFIFYIFFIESYQFYYVITLFNEASWAYNAEDGIWALEFESPRVRLKQQYLLLCLIAKYWHFLFIFLSWIFFLMKSFEQRRTHYTLFGVNLQNFIILYGLNILFLINWVRWVGRRYFDSVYFWFFINTNLKFSTMFFYESYWTIVNIV